MADFKFGLRVLIVDDNVDAADTLAVMLQLWGCETRCAYTGPAAVEAALDYKPQIIFLDIGLPGLNGYEVARKLLDIDFKNTLMVALTGYGSAQDRQRAMDAGFDFHLVKPVNPEVLLEVLTSSSRRQERSSPPLEL